MRKFLLTTGIVAMACIAQAQEIVVKGTVKAEDGRPVAFANISIPSEKTGTIANSNGAFILQLAKPGLVIFKISSVGFKSIEQKIEISAGGKQDIQFVLPANGSLQEVIVSASRKQETLDQVPSSVTIISPKDLEIQKSISNNISDILMNSVPGLGFSSNQTSNSGQTLRGRNVLVMIDGIPQSTPLRNGARDIRTIDPSAIERVEVIKGATAIYGNGADGGLINYITKKADRNKSGLSGKTTLGLNTQLKDAQHTGGFNLGQLLSGNYKKFDFVVSGHYEQTGVYKDADGTVISPTYGLGETQLWNAFTKLGFQVNDKNRVELMYNFFGSQQRSDYVAVDGVYPTKPATGVLGKRLGDPEGTPYNHNGSLHYTSRQIVGNTDLDVNLYFQDFNTVYYWTDSWEGGGQSQINSKKRGLRINLATPFNLGGNIQSEIVYGLDVLNDKTDQSLTDGRLWVPQMDMKNIAPYAQLKATFWDHFVFKAGARYENINIDVPDFTTIVSKNTKTGAYDVGGVPVKGGTIDYNAFVFNAGLRYNKLGYFKPFISYSQSFSVNELGRILRSAEENTIALLNTKAVIANNYEFGFSGTAGPVSYEANTYISTSKLGANYVEVDGKFQIARDPQKIYGFEMAADVRILKNMGMGASYSYIEGKLDINKNGKYNDAEDVYMGGEKIAPPKLTAYIRYQPLRQWNVRLQMLYAGNRDRFEPSTSGTYTYGKGPVSAFALFNLYSSFDFDTHSSLQLGVDNLFNKDYYLVYSQWDARGQNYLKGTGTRVNLTYNYKF